MPLLSDGGCNVTELNFKGKEFVYNHHLAVPFRPLEPHPKKGIGPVALDGNLIIHGDNLHALKALLPMYAGKVDCIFIDPPYNTGNEGWSYNDNVNAPMIKEWLNAKPAVPQGVTSQVPPSQMIQKVPPPPPSPGIGGGIMRGGFGPPQININGSSHDPEALATLVQRRIDESMNWRTHDTDRIPGRSPSFKLFAVTTLSRASLNSSMSCSVTRPASS